MVIRMIYLLIERWSLVLLLLGILLFGILLVISGFKVKSNKKYLRIALSILGIITIIITLYGIVFLLLIGFNS